MTVLQHELGRVKVTPLSHPDRLALWGASDLTKVGELSTLEAYCISPAPAVHGVSMWVMRQRRPRRPGGVPGGVPAG